MTPEDKAKELGVEFTKQEPGYLNLCIRSGNLLITSGHTSTATGVLVGGAGSNFTGNYNCQARSELTVTLVGAIDVKTTAGQTLFRWNTNAHSGLDYGSRDDNPPVAPSLTVGNSPAGDDFTGRMLDALNRMMLDVLAAVARKDYEEQVKQERHFI